jgi:hypothetical protein
METLTVADLSKIGNVVNIGLPLFETRIRNQGPRPEHPTYPRRDRYGYASGIAGRRVRRLGRAKFV